MSKRAYEDGTPAAYEPKVEPWMRMAAGAIGCMDPDEEFRRIMRERSIGPEQAAFYYLEHLSETIARHAPGPEPRPIRRGDVVQMVKPLHEDDFDRHQVSIVMAIEDDRANLYYGGWQPIAELVRIGRARYYPDGTVVED